MNVNYALIRPDIRAELDAWGSGKQPYLPGSFLTAVLENNLAGAFGRADADNLRALYHIVAYVRNQLPSNCWGSPAAVREWLDYARRSLVVRE